MNCDEIKDSLYDYIRNELTVREISALETHLKSCASCASELAHVKGISSIIKASMEEPHPSVLQHIDGMVRPSRPRFFPAFLKPVLVAALFLMTAAAGLLYYANRPISVDASELPEEIALSYAVLENDFFENDTYVDDPAPKVNTEDKDNGYYAGSTQFYTGGYTPVSYIIGQ